MHIAKFMPALPVRDAETMFVFSTTEQNVLQL